MKNQLILFHSVAALPALSQALRRHAEKVATTDPAQADSALKEAYRRAKWAVRFGRLFPTELVPALRELALLQARRGKLRAAIKCVDKSCVVAEQQKAKYEFAKSLLVRGRFAKELGLPEADDQIEKADKQLASFQEQIRLTLQEPVGGHSSA